MLLARQLKDITESMAEPLAVSNLLETGRRAWPDVEVTLSRFTEHLEQLGGTSAEILATDLYLACACADGDAAALRAFDRECVPAIEHAVSATGATPAERAELVQIVRTRLLVAAPGELPRIASYSGRGALKSWVRVVATREAARLLEKERRQPLAGDDDLATLIAPDDDAELGYMKRLYRGEFRAAFGAAVAALTDKERVLLCQHELDGLSIDELAAFYRAHRSTTARWVQAARAAVVDGTRRELAARLRVDSEEIDSIMRLIRSNLDVSLPSLLRTVRLSP
jgi:RNA polymerase sigma-70 factor, ECF subfamily